MILRMRGMRCMIQDIRLIEGGISYQISTVADRRCEELCMPTTGRRRRQILEVVEAMVSARVHPAFAPVELRLRLVFPAINREAVQSPRLDAKALASDLRRLTLASR